MSPAERDSTRTSHYWNRAWYYDYPPEHPEGKM